MTLKTLLWLLVLFLDFLGPLKAQEIKEIKKNECVVYCFQMISNNGISGYGHEMVKTPKSGKVGKKRRSVRQGLLPISPMQARAGFSILTGLRPDTNPGVFDLKTNFRDQYSYSHNLA